MVRGSLLMALEGVSEGPESRRSMEKGGEADPEIILSHTALCV